MRIQTLVRDGVLAPRSFGPAFLRCIHEALRTERVCGLGVDLEGMRV